MLLPSGGNEIVSISQKSIINKSRLGLEAKLPTCCMWVLNVKKGVREKKERMKCAQKINTILSIRWKKMFSVLSECEGCWYV